MKNEKKKILTESDLKKKFRNFKNFFEFPDNMKFLIDKGALAQFYCILLFNHKLNPKFRTESIDLLSINNNKYNYEVKNRHITQKKLVSILNGKASPDEVPINFDDIDFVYYVYLHNKSFMPLCIFKIPIDEIKKKKNRKRKNAKGNFGKEFRNNIPNIKKFIIYKDTKFFDKYKNKLKDIN